MNSSFSFFFLFLLHTFRCNRKTFLYFEIHRRWVSRFSNGDARPNHIEEAESWRNTQMILRSILIQFWKFSDWDGLEHRKNGNRKKTMIWWRWPLLLQRKRKGPLLMRIL